ncbi:hypothetical protein JCM16303_000450 [Sporobolomyces ruberrimus]
MNTTSPPSATSASKSASNPMHSAQSSGFATGMPGGGPSSTNFGVESSTTVPHANQSSRSAASEPSSSSGIGAGSSGPIGGNETIRRDYAGGHSGSSATTGAHHNGPLKSTLGNSSTSTRSDVSQHGSHSNPGLHGQDLTGHNPGFGDKLAGTATKLVGKATGDSKKVIEGETRKEDRKEGLQAAKAEGAL